MNGQSAKYIISIMIMVLLGLTVIFSAFVIFSTTEKEKNKDTISNGSIVMTYTEETNGISVNNKLTMKDDIGSKMSNIGEYFDFAVTSNIDYKSKISAKYEIAIIKDSSSTLNDNDIKIYLEKKDKNKYIKVFGPTNFIGIDKQSKIGAPAGSMIIYEREVKKEVVDEYRLRIWISEKAKDFKNKTYLVKVNIYGKAI